MQLARQFFHRRLSATAVLRGPYSKTLCLSEGRFRGVRRGRSWFLFSQVTGVLMAVAPDRGSGAGVRPRDGATLRQPFFQVQNPGRPRAKARVRLPYSNLAELNK